MPTRKQRLKAEEANASAGNQPVKEKPKPAKKVARGK